MLVESYLAVLVEGLGLGCLATCCKIAAVDCALMNKPLSSKVDIRGSLLEVPLGVGVIRHFKITLLTKAPDRQRRRRGGGSQS